MSRGWNLLRAPGLWLALAGGLLFLGAFEWRYAQIDRALYQFRDDGVITLSHARNWVDFGFIGINPSGERIEATSAPLQMFLYAIVYAISHAGYESFMRWQTLVATFALGALFASFFRQRPLFGLAASAAAAYLLTQLSSFMLWHGSGMENAVTHVTFIATLLVLYRAGQAGRLDLRLAIVPFLASISRVEAIFHIAALLVVFSLHWHAVRKDRQALVFSAAVGLLWLLFNLWRYLYFGSLLPNTAIAQGISVRDRLLDLATLNPLYLQQSFSLAANLFSRHGGYLLLIALPLVVARPVRGAPALLLGLAGCLLVTALAAPFVFGPARLSPSRTTTQFAPAVLLCLAAAAQSADLIGRGRRYAVLACALLAYLVHDYGAVRIENLCCDARAFESVRRQFERFGQEQGIARPTVATPDLGAVSWHKEFNVVDLGLLGSPVVARLQGDPALNQYFYGLIAPDILQTHSYWTCLHADLWTDARFQRMYAPLDGSARAIPCKNGRSVPSGYWVRRDILKGAASAERVLLDDLQARFSTERLVHEIESCQAAHMECSYVARTAYRFLPELRRHGDFGRVHRAFSHGPTREADLALIDGAEDALAYRRLVDALKGAVQDAHAGTNRETLQ